MLVHFPIALWPAHWVLHLVDRYRPTPDEVEAVGFWILAAATVIGWVAAMAGTLEMPAVQDPLIPGRNRQVLWHAWLNGTVLTGFTLVTAWEYLQPRFPAPTILIIFEAGLLVLLLVGSHFGGRIVWGDRERG